MSWIVAQSISILSYDTCTTYDTVFEFSLTERKLIHGSICLVSRALFLEKPYACFRPYHLTVTALIRNFFHRVFQRNCARERGTCHMITYLIILACVTPTRFNLKIFPWVKLRLRHRVSLMSTTNHEISQEIFQQ